jgi:hypothetical protein
VAKRPRRRKPGEKDCRWWFSDGALQAVVDDVAVAELEVLARYGAAPNSPEMTDEEQENE